MLKEIILSILVNSIPILFPRYIGDGLQFYIAYFSYIILVTIFNLLKVPKDIIKKRKNVKFRKYCRNCVKKT